MKIEKNGWKHWLIYSSCLFLFLFVTAEFTLSMTFFSLVAPSMFVYYFTPVGFFFGESLISLFASTLLFVGLLLILKRRVYVKNEDSLKFNRSKSHLLLPFYVVSLTSLAVYISLIPLELSNLITYAFFILLFESFVEHIQVSDYGGWIKGMISKVSGRKKVTTIEDLQPIPEEKITVEIYECPVCGVDVDEDATRCPECGEPFEEEQSLDEILDELEELEEEPTHTECPVCGTEVKKDAKRCPLCGEPFEEEEEINECPVCGAEIPEGATECEVCGEPVDV